MVVDARQDKVLRQIICTTGTQEGDEIRAYKYSTALVLLVPKFYAIFGVLPLSSSCMVWVAS
jgi:hypothetical protein